MFTLINLTTKKIVAETPKDEARAPHSDLLLISFLIPVIALSGVKSEAGHDSTELMLGALDGP